MQLVLKGFVLRFIIIVIPSVITCERSWWHPPLCEVMGRPARSAPGSCSPLFAVTRLSLDKPRAGRHAHLQGQGLHAAVHARQLGVQQRWAAHAVTGVGAGGVDVEHGRRARGEAGRAVGTGQVLQLGIRGNLGREVLDGHAGVQTVGVDFVQVSQAGGTTQRLQHPNSQAQKEMLMMWINTT